MFLMPLTFTEKREELVVGRSFVSIQQSDSHSFPVNVKEKGRHWDWQETDLSRPHSWEQRGRSSSAVRSHSKTRRSSRDRRPVSQRAGYTSSPDDRVAEALQAAVDLLGEDNPENDWMRA